MATNKYNKINNFDYNIPDDTSGLGSLFVNLTAGGKKTPPKQATSKLSNPFQNNYRYDLKGDVIPTNFENWWSNNIEGKSLKDIYGAYSNKVTSNPIGATISKWAPWVAGGIQGVNAIQGLSQNSELTSQYDDLQGDILRSFESNPLASTYLTTDQMGMINRLKRGYEDVGAFDGVLEGIGSGLGDTLGAAALGLATGNPIAALVNAGGSLINSGIQGHQNAINGNIEDLQSLYSALQMAENEYNTERRQRYADRIRGGIL